MAGFPDQAEEAQEFSRPERFVFDDENCEFSPRWDRPDGGKRNDRPADYSSRAPIARIAGALE